VGANQSAARVEVEPTHRHHPRTHVLQIVGHGGPTLRILQGADDAARLVQHEIDERLSHDQTSIHLDPSTRSDPHAELALNSAVHPYATGADQRLGVAPRRDTGASQHLLQAFVGHGYAIRKGRGSSPRQKVTTTYSRRRALTRASVTPPSSACSF